MAVMRRQRRKNPPRPDGFSPGAIAARRAIATLLQKEFDSRGAVAYTNQTDGVGALAADEASGLRDDLETRSSLLRGGGGGFRSSWLLALAGSGSAKRLRRV